MDPYLFAQPCHMQYLMSVCSAIAHPATQPFPEPPFADARDYTLEHATFQLGLAALGGTIYARLHDPRDPMDQAVISQCLDNMPLLDMHRSIQCLQYLQDAHTAAENTRLRREAYEAQLREQRLALTVAERRANLKGFLATFTEPEGWYPLNATADQLTDVEAAPRRRLQVMQALTDPRYPTLAAIAQHFDVSPGRIGQIRNRILRRWRHPAYYGTIFQLDTAGGLRDHATTLTVLDPETVDADGNPGTQVYLGLSFREAIAQLQAFLGAYDATLRIGC